MIAHFLLQPRLAFARRWLWRAIQILAVLQVVMQFGFWLPAHLNRADVHRDIPIYYRAAQAARTGRPLYRPYENYGPNLVPNRYFYPPPFAAALALVTRGDLRTFARAWYLLLLAAFWCYSVCIARLAGGSNLSHVLIAGLVLQLWPGANVAMSYGNAEPLMWALLGASLAMSSSAARGGAIAAAALIKVHPLLALAVAMRHETRRYIIAAAATLAAGLGLGTIVCGAGSFAAWRAAAAPVAAQGTFLGNNVSLSFACLRLANFFGWHYSGGPLPTFARLYLLMCAVGAPLLVMWKTRRCEARWQLALVMSATVLFAPLCWDMYLPILLLPASLWWQRIIYEVRSNSTVLPHHE